jgi:uncharacterized membrane-anchored protein YhcB (DUF1043 family)
MNWKTCGVTNVLKCHIVSKSKKKCKKVGRERKKSWQKVGKKCQKIVKIVKKKKVVKKLPKSCQKVVKKLAKSWQKIVKKLAKSVNMFKKLSKSWQKKCHILVSGLHCLTYSALNDLFSIKSGSGVGVQKVLSRPSADSFGKKAKK